MTGSISKQSASAFHQSENNEIDLRGVLNLIKQGYKLIAVITAICLIAGIYYAQTRPPVYRSTALIEVAGSQSSSALGGGSSAALLGSLQQTSSADVETVLLQSPYVLSQVIQKMGFDISVSPQYPGFFARKLAEYRHVQSSATIPLLNVPNSLLGKPLTLMVQNKNQYKLLTQDGSVILTGKVGQVESANYLSEPLQIKVTALKASSGAKFSVAKQSIPDVSNGVAHNLAIKEEGTDTGVLSLSYTSGNPEQAQKIVNMVLAAAVTKNVKERTQEAAKTLQFISHQLPFSKAYLQKAETKLSQYSVKSGVFDPKTEGPALSQTLNKLQQNLEKLKFKKMVLLQSFTSLHPLVIAVTQQENQIKAQINEVKMKLEKFPLTGEKEMSLQSEAKIQASIYTALQGDVQKMEMMKASAISSIRILSPASYPTSPVPVKKRAIVFGSIILGLMISLAYIFLRHVLSSVIEDPDVVEQALGIPVLAIIPHSQKQMAYNKKAERDKGYANANPFLLARENAKDLSIEGIRSLRTAIQMSLLDAKDNVIAITGCSPSIGKSFISSNLAVLMSDLDKRILVIDSDIRLGKLHHCFGKMKAPGLATFLQNEVSLDHIIQNVIPEKLDFISAGLYPHNPSELLSQNMLGDLIHTLKSRYDLVILDTPPILAVTDPALVLRNSSTNLMVLGIGKDQMKEVQHAKNMLEKGGVKLTGIVFNTISQKKSGSAYGYGKYNYQYAYEK